MTVFPMAKLAIRNLLTRPATRRYPYAVRPTFAASRGQITIDFPACIFCGACSRHCPADAIVVDRATGLWRIDRFACVNCGECVRACPKKCLAMDQERAKACRVAETGLRVEEHVKPPAPKPAAAAQAAPEAGDA